MLKVVGCRELFGGPKGLFEAVCVCRIKNIGFDGTAFPVTLHPDKACPSIDRLSDPLPHTMEYTCQLVSTEKLQMNVSGFTEPLYAMKWPQLPPGSHFTVSIS